MKKTTSSESANTDLIKAFWRWFSLSVLALLVASAIPALSADVFIDEGDDDFATTPVSTASPVGDKAPASEDVPPAAPGTDIDTAKDAEMDALGAPPAISDQDLSLDEPNSTATSTTTPAPAEPKTVKSATKPKHKELKKVSKKKKTVKKVVAKKSAVKKAKKSKISKKTKATKKSKKPMIGMSVKMSKRKVASVMKYAGGRYKTTSKECSLESSPGAGDAVGITKSARKLWVEDSGNSRYWKVYGKSGTAAFVSRDCF